MTGTAEITSNYWYWSYTPMAINSVRDRELSYETISFMVCQNSFAELDDDMRAKGLSLSGLDVAARADLNCMLGRSPVSWRYMIGLN